MSQRNITSSLKVSIYNFTIVDDEGSELRDIMVDANDVLDDELWLNSYGHYLNPEVKLMATDVDGDDVIYFFEVCAEPALLQ